MTLDEIKSVERHNARLRVLFRDGSIELWSSLPEAESVFSVVFPQDPFTGPFVSVLTEKLINDLDHDAEMQKRLFLIERASWRKANFITKRLVIHKLIEQILSEGWTDIAFNNEDLNEDLLNTMNMDLTRHVNGKTIAIYVSLSPGRMIMEQFTDWCYKKNNTLSIKEAWAKPDLLLRAINKVLSRWRRDATKHNVLWALSNIKGVGIPFIPPNAYRTIIKCFDLSGKVIADPFPNPSKAFAAFMEDCDYHGDTFPELAEFLDTEFYPLGNRNYDCVFLDNEFVFLENAVEDLWSWRGRADCVIIFVPKDKINIMPKPDKYLKVELMPNDCDYLFYYE